MGTDIAPDGSVETDDPTQRVHHHARTDGGDLPAGSIKTLCGLVLAGKRPDAPDLPCCPMCAAEMGVMGRRCR